jgi:hydroxyethylthiazole kinase-like uncharacterized protein yjeF
MRILNASQMREADRRTIEEIGIPSLVLMENAGRQVVAAIEAHFEDVDDRHVAVLAGRGNNGGDGFVVARTLLNRGVNVAVFVVGSLDEVKGDARVNLEILGRLGLSVVEIANEQQWELHSSEVSACDLIVDAIFGTGLKTPVAGTLETIVADLNEMGIPIVSIDLPSGMSADTHQLTGDCVQAAVTVTLGAPKLPLVLPPEVIDEVDGPRLEIITPAPLRDHQHVPEVALVGARRPRPEQAVEHRRLHYGKVDRIVVFVQRGRAADRTNTQFTHPVARRRQNLSHLWRGERDRVVRAHGFPLDCAGVARQSGRNVHCHHASAREAAVDLPDERNHRPRGRPVESGPEQRIHYDGGLAHRRGNLPADRAAARLEHPVVLRRLATQLRRVSRQYHIQAGRELARVKLAGHYKTVAAVVSLAA